ncbi:hypothetical protein EKK58_01150 [Candidatus Dependentiae bacterium]|nr:MAG: hypothetical protein EKK58_01150 [Candidatus Dependentiae bacterium]
MSDLYNDVEDDQMSELPYDQEDLMATAEPLDFSYRREYIYQYLPGYFNRLDHLAYVKYNEQKPMSSVFSFSASSCVSNVASLADYVVSPGFDPGEDYRGPTNVFVADQFTKQEIPAVRLAGQVVLPRYPSASGFADINGYFLGGLMAPKKAPFFPCLVGQEGSYGTNPMIYCIRNGLDLSVVPGVERIKAGRTGNRTSRRSNHQSNSPAPTRAIMEVRPEKYTLESLEKMLLTALAPWLASGREFFDIPYVIRHDLSKITTEAALIKYCAVLCTPAGIARVNLLESALVQGSIQHLNHGRMINVDTTTVIGTIEQEVVPQS